MQTETHPETEALSWASWSTIGWTVAALAIVVILAVYFGMQ